MNIANIFKSFIHTVLDFLFPRQCLGCQREGTWLCQRCLEKLPSSFSPREAKIFSVFEYNSPVVKQVIWHLKYKRGLDLAEILARPMHDTLLNELEDELIITRTKIILIPVPLAPARLRSRGYNQAEELAKQIARFNPEQFEVRADLIKKIKNTPTQVSIRNREARLKNLKDSFVLQDFRNPTSKNNDIFVIIDDVSTTGATINEIRRLLAKAGTSYIYGLVIAHG